MQREIIDFYLDEEGDWVALLSCHHGQHVRHQPPFVNRPWVITGEGRDAMLGTRLNCVRCDRLELPDQMELVQRTDECTHEDAPEELIAGLATKPGIWTRILIQEGQLVCHVGEPFSCQLIGTPLQEVLIPPEVLYSIEPNPPLRFYLEYYGPPRR